MLVLFFHHDCGVTLTWCRLQCTVLPHYPAEVKTSRVCIQKKLNKLLSCSSSSRPMSGLATGRTGTRAAIWRPEILHGKLPLLWLAWSVTPWQGVVWCSLKPVLFLEDKKKKQQSVGICSLLCTPWCLWVTLIRKWVCLKNSLKMMIVVQLDEFLVLTCLCPYRCV